MSDKKTLVDLVLYAYEHPLSTVGTEFDPQTFANYTADFAGGRILVISERGKDGREIHVSLSSMHATVVPSLLHGITLMSCLERILGLVDRWEISENVVHWHWPAERAEGLRRIAH